MPGSPVSASNDDVSAERRRCAQIALLESGYWGEGAGCELDLGAMGAAANIYTAIDMGWTVEEVQQRIASRDK